MRRGNLRTAILICAVAALVAGPALAQAKDHTKIKYPALPELVIPSPLTFQLDNGMTVMLMENHELPLISANAMIRTGSNYEPAEKTGLADLFGEVQRTGGTTAMNGDEMDDYLAARAAYVETGIGGDSGSAGMNCLADDFDDVFKLFAEVLRSPALPDEKLELAKVQATTGIARRNDFPDGIAGREFSRKIYGGDSPLTHMTEYATIEAISRDDLVAWHKKYYHPNNILLGIVGDFDAEAMKAKVQAVLGDWKKGPQMALPEVPYRTEPDKGIYFVEKSDVTQSNIRIGHLGIQQSNPDYFAVQVLNQVLGGSFGGRLFSNVRSEQGLAYSVYGGVGSSYLRQGVFRVGMETASENTVKAINSLKAEIRGIIDNPPSADEMQRAKDVILNSFIFNYTSRQQILYQQMSYAYYGLPADYLETYRTNIEKVTAEQAAQAAKKYIHPDQLTLLVVGKAADFDQPLSSLGTVTALDIAIPPPPDTGPKVEKSAASLAAGKELFDRIVKTTGGSDPDGVSGYRSSGSMEITMPQGAMALGLEVLVVYPERMRMLMKTPMGDQLVVIDGDSGFAGAGGQFQDLPPEAIEDQRKNLYRDLFYLVANRDDAGLETLAAGSAEADGTACDLLQVTYHETKTVLCVVEDGRVLQISYQGEHPFNRAPGTMVTLYSDFRELDGRPVPHKEMQTFNGDPVINLTWESFELNPEAGDDEFARPTP